ncbi:MAG: WYL domain-containing protein [Micrococcaceae bacterium]
MERKQTNDLRVINLFLVLANTRWGLTFPEIAQKVEVYKNDYDNALDNNGVIDVNSKGYKSLKRKFERDKKQLQNRSIVIRVDGDSNDLRKARYRIDFDASETADFNVTLEDNVILNTSFNIFQDDFYDDIRDKLLGKLSEVEPRKKYEFFGRTESSVDNDKIMDIREAIARGNVITFEYQKPELKAEERKIVPYGIGKAYNEWYIHGYDLAKNDTAKNFKFNRIEKLKINSTIEVPVEVKRPKDFDINKALSSIGSYDGIKTVKVEIAENIAKRFNDNFISNNNGKTYTYSYTHQQDAVDFLSMFAGQIKILEPKEIVNAFITHQKATITKKPIQEKDKKSYMELIGKEKFNKKSRGEKVKITETLEIINFISDRRDNPPTIKETAKLFNIENTKKFYKDLFKLSGDIGSNLEDDSRFWIDFIHPNKEISRDDVTWEPILEHPKEYEEFLIVIENPEHAEKLHKVTFKESIFLISILKTLLVIKQEDTESITKLIGKIKASFPIANNPEVENTLMPTFSSDDVIKKLRTISKAIADNKKLKYTYTSPKTGNEAEKIKEIEGFFNKDGNWYIHTWQGYNYRIDNMRNLVVTDQKYDVDEIQNYIKKSAAKKQDNKVIYTALVNNPNSIFRTKYIQFDKEKKEIAKNKEVSIVEFSASSENYVVELVCGAGDKVAVLEPEGIEEQVKERAEKAITDHS